MTVFDEILRMRMGYNQDHASEATQVVLGTAKADQLKREMAGLVCVPRTDLGRLVKVCGLEVIPAHYTADPNQIIVGVGDK